MSFGKRTGMRYPALIKDLDYNNLQNFQIAGIADYLGVLRVIRQGKGIEGRAKLLKDAVQTQLVKAQEAYDIIVHKKLVAGAGSVAPDAEKRCFELMTQIVVEHDAAIGEKAFKAVSQATEAVTGGIKKQVQDAIKEAADRAVPIVIKDGGKLRKVKGVLPPEFKQMVELASARIPIMLVGPAGCGKTYLCEKLGEALGLEVSDQSCSEGMSENVFNGLLLPIGKGGEFKHVASPFMSRYESGGVMLLDEIDAGDPNLFTYINKAIANRHYTVAQRWTNPVVKKHKDFVLVAAANTFGHGADASYVGRNQLDAATLDRFKVGLITLDYCQDVELSLADAELCAWAWRVRAAIKANKLRRIMSTRVIENLGTMSRTYGWKQPEWEKAFFTGWPVGDRNLVRA